MIVRHCTLEKSRKKTKLIPFHSIHVVDGFLPPTRLSYRLFDRNTSTWSEHIDIKTYQTGEIKGYSSDWFPASEVIPEEAKSPNTKFSWRQIKFNERNDHFAIDDVEIVANFDPGT
jgi:hypothetical protein